MNSKTQAISFVKAAAGTALGRQAMDELFGRTGRRIILANPEGGPVEEVAARLQATLHQRYPQLF
jgi:hypothetical protein